MKINQKNELHEKSIDQLQKELSDLRKELSGLNFDHQMGKVKNTSSLRNKRQQIAVIGTILNEKRALERIVKEKSKGGKK